MCFEFALIMKCNHTGRPSFVFKLRVASSKLSGNNKVFKAKYV